MGKQSLHMYTNRRCTSPIVRQATQQFLLQFMQISSLLACIRSWQRSHLANLRGKETNGDKIVAMTHNQPCVTSSNGISETN